MNGSPDFSYCAREVLHIDKSAPRRVSEEKFSQACSVVDCR